MQPFVEKMRGCLTSVLAASHFEKLYNKSYFTPPLCFIKFYKEKVINVVCEITDKLEYNITTWFEIKQNSKIKQHNYSERIKDTRWRYRRGLLIKKS